MPNKKIREQINTMNRKRHATKSFDSTKKIDPKDFETIIESARLSPSSFGYEPWKFLLINKPEIKEDLKEFAGGAINSLNGASHFIITLARKNVTYDSPHVQYIVENILGHTFTAESPQSQFFKNFQENNFDLNTHRTLLDWASKQTYIPLANMMTSAALLGIDSCPIEGFDKEKVENYLAEKELIDLDEFGVSYMLGLGYGNDDIPTKKRQPLVDILKIID